MAKGSFSFLIILMLTLVPAFVAAITIVAVPVQSSITPRLAAVAPLDNVSTTTFGPTFVFVQATTTTQTSTSTVYSERTSTTTSVSVSSVSTTKTLTETSTTTSPAGMVPGMDPALNVVLLVVAVLMGVLIGGIIAWVISHGRPPSSPQEKHWCNPDENCGPTGTHGCYPNAKSTCSPGYDGCQPASCMPFGFGHCAPWPMPNLREGERMCSKCNLYKVVVVNCAGCGNVEANCSCGGPVGIAVGDPGVPSDCHPSSIPCNPVRTGEPDP